MNGSWDDLAATFDDEPDHGLRDPSIRAAWAALLSSALPAAPATVLDMGCGTGSLAALLTEAGHHVRGLDASAEMLRLARRKTPGTAFVRGDAARPPFAPGCADVVLCRHVLWAVPDPATTLERWTALLRPGYRRDVEVQTLTDEAYWGGPVTDERYLLLSRG